MLFLQCLSSVRWLSCMETHRWHTQKGSGPASVYTDIMIASAHRVSNLHNTPLTLRFNIHKSCAWVTRVMRRRCADYCSCSWFEGSWRANLLYFFFFLQRALMFLQAQCQIPFSTAHGCAVKAGKEWVTLVIVMSTCEMCCTNPCEAPK